MINYFNFPRSCKLVTKADFKRVFDESSKISQKHLLVLYKPNLKPYARLGVIVGKRVANLAVSRNCIKRVVRDSFRLTKMQLTGLDIIVIARHQCDTLDKVKLRKGIDDLWARLKKQYPKHLSS